MKFKNTKQCWNFIKPRKQSMKLHKLISKYSISDQNRVENGLQIHFKPGCDF